MIETNRPSLAVLSSGNDSSVEALIRATQNGSQPRVLDADVRMVISDQSESEIFNKVEALNIELGLDIKTPHISDQTHPGGEGNANEQTLAESEAIAKYIRAEDITLVALVGYSKRLRGELWEDFSYHPKSHQSAYAGKIVLSSLGGTNLAKKLTDIEPDVNLESEGITFTEQSLIIIDRTPLTPDSDEYKIVGNSLFTLHKLPVLPDDTAATLYQRIQKHEAVNLPKDLNTYLQFHMGYADRNPSNSS